MADETKRPAFGLVLAICAFTLLCARAADAQIVANGKTLTVTTTNAVATFNGPDLVGFANSLTSETYLKKPSNGDLVQVDRIASTGQALQTSNWTIGTEQGTGLPLATITAQDSARMFTMTVKIDPASQEIVLRSSASVTSGGVRGASWSIAGLDLAAGQWIVPANSGSVFDAAHPGVGAFIAYPNSWQAQMAVYQAAAGSFLLYSTDTQIYFKDLHQSTRGDSMLDVAVYTEATAPWPSATAVPQVEWRLKAFAGDWRAAATPFRDWMVATHPPLSNAAHPWVSNIRTVVEIGYHDTALLTLLSAKTNPSQTLLYIPDWRQYAYDVNYPDYMPAAGVAAFISSAHALGFKVMLHTDIIGVAPTNGDYAAMQPYQTKTPETLQPIGQFWDQPGNPLRYGLIDPAAAAFRSLWITRVSAAVNAVNPDALHLDFTAMYNDGNGPIEGRTFTQGEEFFNQQIVAAFPNLAIGAEEEFDFTFRYHSFAQADLFAFSAPGHPISPFLFSPQIDYYSNLNAPPVSDPSFKSHLLDMQRRTIFPLWWVAGSADLDVANVDNARFIGMVQSFQAHLFQPAWTADWTGALVRYEGLAGATAALTDDGRITTLATSTPSSTLFQLAHDADQLTTGSFIDRWPAFDGTTLYGLNPRTLYFLDQVARPDATHATSLPQGIQLGSGTLITPSFAHVEFVAPTLVDFTDLSQARLGVRYQGADYPIGFGAVVQAQTNTVGGETRPSIFIHPPWQGQVGGETFAEFSVPVPSAAALRFSVGVDDAASCTDGVTFRVTVSGSELWHQNFNRGAWHDVVLSLAAYAGTTVPVRLISNPGPASNPNCDFGAWTKVGIAVPTSTISVPMTLASGSIFSGIDGASYSGSSVSGTVTNVTVPGEFTVFTQQGTTVAGGTGLTALPFDVWSTDQSGGLLKSGSVFNAGVVQSETSGGVTKNPAIWAHPPNGGRTVLSWALRLPANPLKLAWSAGVIDNAYSDDGVTFDVRINGLPYWSLVTGIHGDNHWTAGQLDLSRWQGQSILLELVTDSRGTYNADWAAWGDLVLSGSSVSCSYGVPSSASVGGIGGTSTANITATATCPWSATSSVPWLTVVSGAGSGSGTLTYDVAPNLGAARSGTLTIAGQTLTVSQPAAPPPPPPPPTTLNLSQDLVALGIAATNMVPNQPSLDAGPIFVAGVNYAKTHGMPTVIADPGAYYFLSVTDNTHVAVSGIDNMTIDLHGADLIFTHPLFYGMIVYYSTNAVVQNFTVDYQPLPFTQVRVASVDTANARILYTVEPGWADPSSFNSFSGPAGAPGPTVDIQVFRGGRRVLGRLFTQRPFNGTTIPIVGTDPGTTLAGVRPGDVAVIALRYFTTAIGTNHCSGCTLRNLTLYSAPSAGFQALDTQNSVLERVYSIPKPGTDRQVSTFGIAMFPVVGPNNQIRLSRAIRTMDDGLALVGLFVGTVQSQSSPRVLVVDGSGGPSILGDGDTIPNGSPVTFQRYSDGVVVASAIIVSQTTPAPAYPHQATFTFDRDLPPGVVGAAFYTTDASQDAANSVVERSLVQEPQGRLYIGGLVNSSARGNYIRRTALSGVFMYQSTAPGDTLTVPLTNMTVSNNVIDGTNMASNWWWDQFASIQSVTLTTAYDLMTGSLFSNLNITNNFIADSGRSGVWLGNTTGGSITGNYLLNPNVRPDTANAYGGRPGDELRPLVVDKTSTGVTTSNNVIDNTSGRVHVTDTQYRELAAYAPGSTLRLSAYNVGGLAGPTATLTDADGVTATATVQAVSTHAIDVQLPSGAALGGAYVTLTSGATKYFGTLFVDSQDNIPALNGCVYEASLSSTSVAATAGSLPVLVVTQPSCPYQVSASDAWVTPGAGGSGTAVISVAFAANTGGVRHTTIEIAGQPFTITQNGGSTIPPTMTLDKTSLIFSAVTNGAAFISSTQSQAVRLTQTGAGAVTWTATSNAAWLRVANGSGAVGSSASGSGSATLNIFVLFASGLSATQQGTITMTFTGASNAAGPVNVTLNTIANGTSAAPVGAFDTPIDNSTGVTGSIAVTGWSMDDVGVTGVRIMRNPLSGEAATAIINGQPLVFIGDAVLVDGARPDVAALFPNSPRNTFAGWGYLMLTNFLPNLGNGTFVLTAVADDADGHSTILGTKTITCTNADIRAPFGAIDTPAQGGTVSGTLTNFGWVLVPGPARADPPGGGTVRIVIDGVLIATVPAGWTSRSDLSALFSASTFPGISTALGVAGFDTSTLTNGVHTIAWLVTDNQNRASGIGSRYFTVSNGSGLRLASPSMLALRSGESRHLTPVGRRGPDLAAPFEPLTHGADGELTFRAEELDRIELRLQASGGRLRTTMEELPLPIGSRIDPADGSFTWQPGPGFLGRYDLVFDTVEGSQRVQILLLPQGMLSRSQVVIDLPEPGSTVSGQLTVAGWALDPSATDGTGIDAVHVWAYPVRGGLPIFLGVASLGGERPDVAEIYGPQALKSGYGLAVNSLPPGEYDLAVFVLKSGNIQFLPASTRRVVVR